MRESESIYAIEDGVENTGRQHFRGEYMLLWAIVLRAVLDATGTTSEIVSEWRNARKSAALREAARLWIFHSKPNREWSLPWICDWLGLDIERLRRFVMEHQDDWLESPVEQTRLSYEAVVAYLQDHEE